MERRVAVIADGTAAVPPCLRNRYDIGVLPLHVIVDGRDYLETDVDMSWLLERLRRQADLPTTSAPSVGEALRTYQYAAERGWAAVSIHLTSAFSKSYESGLLARALAMEKHPEMQIEVVDSHTAEAGELAIAAAAARLADQGAGFDDVVRKVYEIRDALCNLYCFETLFYRDKGGRIFKAKPWAEAEHQRGTGLKALIEVDHASGGSMQPVCRARTKRQLLNKIVEIARERAGAHSVTAAIVHVNADEEAELLAAMIKGNLLCETVDIAHASAASSVHGGDGFVTCAFY